jgi:hypothetical protein
MVSTILANLEGCQERVLAGRLRCFYRYRWGDQDKEYSCGSWPRKSLTDIRKARNQARALIDEQINPNEHKKTAKAQAYTAANVEAEQVNTSKVQTLIVQDLAKAWLPDGVARRRQCRVATTL